MHMQMHMHMHMHRHMHMHVHMHMHTDMHMHLHLRMHMHMHMLMPGSPEGESQAGRARLCGKNITQRRRTAAVVCPTHLREGTTGWL